MIKPNLIRSSIRLITTTTSTSSTTTTSTATTAPIKKVYQRITQTKTLPKILIPSTPSTTTPLTKPTTTTRRVAIKVAVESPVVKATPTPTVTKVEPNWSEVDEFNNNDQPEELLPEIIKPSSTSSSTSRSTSSSTSGFPLILTEFPNSPFPTNTTTPSNLFSTNAPSSSSPSTPSTPYNPPPSINPTPLPIPVEQREVDWTTSFHGISSSPFSERAASLLMRPLLDKEIEIKPDGLLYLPEILYRRILNQAFGPGGWGMVPRGEMTVLKMMVSREWGLVAGGRLVSVSRGEQTFFDPSGLPTATEGCKSNALMRCCKDLGIASEMWDPAFIRTFKAAHCIEAWTEHASTKKRARRWRKKGNKFEYPLVESKN